MTCNNIVWYSNLLKVDIVYIKWNKRNTFRKIVNDESYTSRSCSLSVQHWAMHVGLDIELSLVLSYQQH